MTVSAHHEDDHEEDDDGDDDNDDAEDDDEDDDGESGDDGDYGSVMTIVRMLVIKTALKVLEMTTTVTMVMMFDADV